MSELLEVIMIVSFGASWPLNVIKSYKARTAKGKSLAFLCLIFFGYIACIISKLINDCSILQALHLHGQSIRAVPNRRVQAFQTFPKTPSEYF